MTVAAFHDFPGLENGLPKLQDFPGPVVTLSEAAMKLDGKAWADMIWTSPNITKHQLITVSFVTMQ